MEFKDYYAALGVKPDANDGDIKSAYRKLARQYHPDVNPGDTKAEDRFKEVNEAYQVLGDAEQRRKYNEMREQYSYWQQRGGSSNDFNWREWQQPAGGVYTSTVTPDDFEDLFGGGYSDFFSSIFGGRVAGASSRAYEPQPRRGRDLELEAEVTLEEAFAGTTRGIQIGDRTIEARIPRGVQNGARIRLSGQGSSGAAGGAAGDLYLNVVVLPNERFERNGDDLTAEVEVDFVTAAVGGEVRVQTLDGTAKLRVPARTQANTRFRLRGKGMPRRGNAEERGDLFARVRIVLPADLSDADLDVLQSLKRA